MLNLSLLTVAEIALLAVRATPSSITKPTSSASKQRVANKSYAENPRRSRSTYAYRRWRSTSSVVYATPFSHPE